jgi:transketolase C-terminal domain/subunit
MVHKALEAQKILEERGVSAGVIDLFRIKRINAKGLAETLSQYAYLVTVEEQILEGGFSSAVLEALADQNAMMPVKRLGIRDGFNVLNGDRDQLHELYGIDMPQIVDAALSLKEA